MNDRLCVLSVQLDGMREAIQSRMLAHHETVEQILEEKLRVALSTERFVAMLEEGIEDAISCAVSDFFDKRGMGYSIISDTVQAELLALMTEKLKGKIE
jgi:hypothetical protein